MSEKGQLLILEQIAHAGGTGMGSALRIPSPSESTMHRFFRPLLFLVPLALLAGCRLLNSTDPREDFDLAFDQWSSQGYGSYSYEVLRSCFCGFPGVGSRVVVVVHEWEPVAAWDADTGEPFTPSEVRSFPTVEDLFDIAEDAIDRADRFSIRYDDRLGYPVEIDIDYIRDAIDDELYIGSDRLEPIG